MITTITTIYIISYITYLTSYIALEYLYKKQYEDYLIKELLEDLKTSKDKFNTFLCLVAYVAVPYVVIAFGYIIYLKNKDKQ